MADLLTAPRILLAAIALGAVAMLIGIDNAVMYRVGLLIFALSSTGYVASCTASRQSIEKAKLRGYDEGFAAGCKAATRARLAGGSGLLSLIGPSEELAEKETIGSGTDRVG